MAANAPTILITGSAGFIGRSLVRQFVEAGWTVRAGTHRRPPTPSADNAPPPYQSVKCDLDSAASIKLALDGVDLVVHAAYNPADNMSRQCDLLTAAMAEQGVANLIYFSSIGVYGQQEGLVAESANGVGPFGEYEMGKRQCEAVVRQWAALPRDPLRRGAILRPGIVYGRGSELWVDKIRRRIEAGAWGTFGEAGEGSAALIHVDDVAELTVGVAQRLVNPDRRSLAATETLNLVGPQTLTWNKYFQAVAAASGVTDLPELSPGRIRRRAGLAPLAKAWKKLHLPGGTALSLAPAPGELALFARKATYATDGVERLLGHGARIGILEGMTRTFAPVSDARSEPEAEEAPKGEASPAPAK